tara:strand:+ start:51 stop:314 length:264 start_codon:yes stop_codon:yes gene_type:complete
MLITLDTFKYNAESHPMRVATSVAVTDYSHATMPNASLIESVPGSPGGNGYGYSVINRIKYNTYFHSNDLPSAVKFCNEQLGSSFTL